MLVLCGYRRGLREEHRVQIQFKHRKNKSGDFLTCLSHAQKKNKCHLVKTGSCSGLDNGTFSQLLQKCSRKLVLQEQLDGSSGSKQAPLISLFRPCWICVPQTHLFKEKSGLLGGKIRGAALRPPVLTPSQSPQIHFCKKNLL